MSALEMNEKPQTKSPAELAGPARATWLKARKRRNWAIFLALISFIVAVYFVAMVRMGGL